MRFTARLPWFDAFKIEWYTDTHQAEPWETFCDENPDVDGDGMMDFRDFCPNVISYPTQKDTGAMSIGGFAHQEPDGIGDKCQCGDVTGDGHVDVYDNLEILMYMLAPDDPNFWVPIGSAEWTPEDVPLCDIDRNGVCEDYDREKGTHGYPGTYGYYGSPDYDTHPGCAPLYGYGP